MKALVLNILMIAVFLVILAIQPDAAMNPDSVPEKAGMRSWDKNWMGP